MTAYKKRLIAAKNMPPNAGKKRSPAAGAASAPNRTAGWLTSDRIRVPAVCGLLLLAVGLVFGQTLRFDFVNYDDLDYVSANPHLERGLSAEGVVWAFTTTRARNWHPLTWLSLLADYELYGLKPWGYHLTNVLLHAAAALVLLWTLWRMTGDFWPAAFTAAVFAVHPLRAESVAWVAERKDVLSGLFFMLTLAAYGGYAGRPFSLARYALVTTLFALGLLAKPMLVTLPFVLLLLDYWPLRRTARARIVLEKLPLFALAAAACIATCWAQSGTIQSVEEYPLPLRVENALVAYAAYLGMFFVPADLAVFYPFPLDGIPLWKPAAALILLAGATLLAIARRREWPWLPVGWFWHLGMLVPVIGLVQVGAQALADRYTYLPQIGLTILLAWSLQRAVEAQARFARAAVAVAALGLLAWFGAAMHQTAFWRDSLSLWTRAAACTRPNALTSTNLGITLSERGRFDEAEARFREALRLNPRHVEAYISLGGLLCGLGRTDEAVKQLQTALDISPDFALAHNNLGAAYAKQKRYPEAVAEYQRALELVPDHVMARNNLGVVLNEMGRPDEAVAQHRKALEIQAKNPETHFFLGNVLAGQRRFDEAVRAYEAALALRPDYAEALGNLGAALFEQGRWTEAVAQWEHVVRLQPENVQAIHRLARLRAAGPESSIRNGPKAVELALRAAQLTGGRDPAVLDTLAAAYAESGRFDEAVQIARQALDLAARQRHAGLEKLFRARIALYQSGMPCRDAPPKPP